MRAETADWLRYAEENAAVAKLARREGHLNACAQNVQQCVEKALKAVVVELALPFRKTHSITDLRQVVLAAGWDCGLTEEECELLDTLYLPSKYPLSGVLPPMDVSPALCDTCLALADCSLEAARRRVPSGPCAQSP